MADRDVERLSIHLSRARQRQSLTGAGDGEDRGVRHALQIPRREKFSPLATLERDDFSSKRHPSPAFCLRMIRSENRFPLFGIML
jgi:hypothetical protein